MASRPDDLTDEPQGPSRGLNPLLTVVLLYLVLGLLIFLAGRYAPWIKDTLWEGGAAATAEALFAGQVGAPDPGEEPMRRVLVLSMFAMAMAFFLTLPVVIVFTITRAKRGYRQALVQTLLMLPIVVSGVLILVKNSLALAFSLGGIVGAVSFRNRLEDPKDAVYVFLAIALGIACGVQVYAIGYSLSLFYSVATLGLWWTDFGRLPARLTGSLAKRRMEQAREITGPSTGNTEEFLSLVDNQVLRSMTPDQLSAIADRAMRHRQKMVRTAMDSDEAFDATIRIVLPSAAAAEVRGAVEAVLVRDAKTWRLRSEAQSSGGNLSLEYEVRFRKKIPAPLLIEAVRRAALPHAEEVVLG